LLVYATVAFAALYLARVTWRSWQASKTGCGGSCGCSAPRNEQQNGKNPLISTDELTARLRQPHRK